MKKHIVNALKWVLAKFEPHPDEVVFEAWPFPVKHELAEKPVKKKPSVQKATTRTTAKKTAKKAK
jgi:hypothetical protein